MAVESTFNWYWLVDGLRAAEYPMVLANPAEIEQYSGIKHADDKNDAFFLAELLRLKILPTGYIYDAELRPVRDLLRRRMSLVHQRTALMLSFKSLYARTTGQTMTLAGTQEPGAQRGQGALRASGQPTDRQVQMRAHRSTGQRASAGSRRGCWAARGSCRFTRSC